MTIDPPPSPPQRPWRASAEACLCYGETIRLSAALDRLGTVSPARPGVGARDKRDQPCRPANVPIKPEIAMTRALSGLCGPFSRGGHAHVAAGPEFSGPGRRLFGTNGMNMGGPTPTRRRWKASASECLLLGVKRTSNSGDAMSAYSHKRKSGILVSAPGQLP